MIQLPIKKLKEFLALSSYVQTDKSQKDSILKYVRITIKDGVCQMVKSNNRAFCILEFSLPVGDVDFLVEEDRFKALCSESDRETYKVTFTAKTTTFNDGYKKSTFNTAEADVKLFPKLPELSEDGTVIDKDVLTTLGIAKNYASEDTIRPALCAVYLSGTDIYASNAQICYVRSFNDAMPNIGITKKECELLSQFDSVEYSISEHYNTYKSGSITFGFIQPDGTKGYDYKFLLNKLTKSNYLKIKKSHLINFCKSTKNFSGDAYLNSWLYIVGDGSDFDPIQARIVFIDKGKEEENEIIVSCELVGENFDFEFNHSIWLDALSCLPYEDICLGNESGVISIWSENDPAYIGIIAKIAS